MPFRITTPGATIFSLIAAGILSLFGGSRCKTRSSKRGYTPYVSPIQRVVDAHRDCTAELFNIFVNGRKRVGVFSELTPGDRVSINLDGACLVISAGHTTIASAELPASSLLPTAFQNGVDIDAYLGGRDVANASETAEFGTIVVFYKLEGVPPTHINLK